MAARTAKHTAAPKARVRKPKPQPAAEAPPVPIADPILKPVRTAPAPKPTKPAKTRAAAKPEPGEKVAKLSPAEREKAISEKYDIEVKEGSLRQDEGGRKWTVTIYCKQCQQPRTIATQDAFQVRTCGSGPCKRAWKRANAVGGK